MNAAALAALQAWLANPSPRLRDACLEAWAPLAKRVWSRMRVSLPPAADSIGDDLVQVGCIGLIQALEAFDPRHGASFETYARLRIRGAMLDELRRMDWVPRTIHEKARKIQDIMVRLEQALGRAATDAEVARAL